MPDASCAMPMQNAIQAVGIDGRRIGSLLKHTYIIVGVSQTETLTHYIISHSMRESNSTNEQALCKNVIFVVIRQIKPRHLKSLTFCLIHQKTKRTEFSIVPK